MGAGTPLNTTTRYPFTLYDQDAVSSDSAIATPLGGRRWRVSFTSEIAGMSFYINEVLIEGDTFAELSLMCRATYGVQSATLYVNGLDIVFIGGFAVELTATDEDTTTFTETTEGVSTVDKINSLLVFDLVQGGVFVEKEDLTYRVQPPYLGQPVTITLMTTLALSVIVNGLNVIITQLAGSTAQQVADLVNDDPVAGNILQIDVTGVGGDHQTDYSIYSLDQSVQAAYAVEQDLTFTVQPAFISDVVVVTWAVGTLTVTVTVGVNSYPLAVADAKAETIAEAINDDVDTSAIVDCAISGEGTTEQTDYTLVLQPEFSSLDTYGFKVWGMNNNTWYIKIPADIGGTSIINTSLSFAFPVVSEDRIFLQVTNFSGAGYVTPRVGLFDG